MIGRARVVLGVEVKRYAAGKDEHPLSLAGEAPTLFSSAHDRTRGLYVVTQPDGTTELFRDNPVRYLVVEPDPQTGAMRPAVKFGRPVYLYLCREHREG